VNGSGGSAVVVASRGGNSIMRKFYALEKIFSEKQEKNDSSTEYTDDSGNGQAVAKLLIKNHEWTLMDTNIASPPGRQTPEEFYMVIMKSEC
jgi:alanine-alpha-ketoisovalerate/valine-pyruvate aminotransferase